MHSLRRDAALAGVERIAFGLTALLLACSVVLGGAQDGQGMAGRMVCQLVSVLLLVSLVLRWHWRGAAPAFPAWAGWLLLLPLLLPLLQLLPLPMALWQQIGVRQALAVGGASAGVDVQAHVSLVPMMAERALWALLPAWALAMAVLSMPARAQRQLLALLLILVVLSLLWGIVQRAQGPASALRLYRYTNATDATGFFANRNHLASLLLMGLPLAMAAAAWLTTQRLAGQPVRPLPLLMALALTVLLILGIALTRSRAGIVLCVLAIGLSVPMVLALRRQRGLRRVLAGVLAIGVLAALQFGLTGILQRLRRNPFEDSRWGLVEGTLKAASEHAPLGAGLGTFRDVYPAYELAGPGSRIVNHAHDDWLELWLEGGWPLLLLASIFLVLFALAGWRIWRAKADDVLLLQTRAAWIGLLLCMLHALVDYALRTTTIMVVFALLAAVLMSGVAALDASGSGTSTSARRRRSASS